MLPFRSFFLSLFLGSLYMRKAKFLFFCMANLHEIELKIKWLCACVVLMSWEYKTISSVFRSIENEGVFISLLYLFSYQISSNNNIKKRTKQIRFLFHGNCTRILQCGKDLNDGNILLDLCIFWSSHFRFDCHWSQFSWKIFLLQKKSHLLMLLTKRIFMWTVLLWPLHHRNILICHLCWWYIWVRVKGTKTGNTHWNKSREHTHTHDDFKLTCTNTQPRTFTSKVMWLFGLHVSST